MNLLLPYVKYGLTLRYKRLYDLYVDKLVSLGVNPGEDGLLAIQAFFNSGYEQGWLQKITKLYIPVWGAAAPNAINLIDSYGSPATFGGSVNHANAQVKSAGGYMDLNTYASSYSVVDCGCGYYITELNSGDYVDMGARATINVFTDFSSFNRFDAYLGGAGTGTPFSVAGVQKLGFTAFNSTAGGQRVTHKEAGTGTLSLLTLAAVASGPMPNYKIYGMAMNQTGVPSQAAIGRGYMCFAVWAGMTDSQCDQLSQAIFDLEEALRS